MPMYDYQCHSCGVTFEELVISHEVSDSGIRCPNCNDKKSKRNMCAPVISTNGKAKKVQSGCAPSSGFT